MKIILKIFGALLLSYPITMLALMAHTDWMPVSGGAAYTLGCFGFGAGLFLLSPALDE